MFKIIKIIRLKVKEKYFYFAGLIILIMMTVGMNIAVASNGRVWTKEKANLWYERQPWIRGCNYIPGTAINPIEMWQAETFDTTTINRELSWAENLGFNTIRVYLHYTVWKNDPSGFNDRIDKFLNISSRHGISVIFIFFDDCWNPEPVSGKQPEPVPGVHNSGWSASPGHHMVKDTTSFPLLKNYVKDIMNYFAYDKRILFWDLYNEAGNGKLKSKSLPLLRAVFRWAREVNPSQPVTSGTWFKNKEINNFILKNSDIITFHNYFKSKKVIKQIEEYKDFGRPLICTEWLRRKTDNNFRKLFKVFYDKKVGCLNWGLVYGKTQTVFSWTTAVLNNFGIHPKHSKEPKKWFHDIMRKDGSPFDKAETDLIRKVCADADSNAFQPKRSFIMKQRITKSSFGTSPDCKDVDIYTITNSHGLRMKVMTYGATVISLEVPDRKGKLTDVVLGYDSLSGYIRNSPYFGATVGRYANRIAKGRFTLFGTIYKLAVNNGVNSLHGGIKGLDKVVWDADIVEEDGVTGITLTYFSKNKEEGYPGDLQCEARYFLNDNNEMVVKYKASTNTPTPVNITNHSYFNLAGQGNGDILNHELTIIADNFTPVDSTLIPTGEIIKVAGTPFDFTQPHKVGERINADNIQLKFGNGYDHNFALNKSSRILTFAARVYAESTGIEMELHTTEMGLQFYSGNFLDGSITGKNGKKYNFRYALCLEPQFFPNSPNQKNFPDCILKPGMPYEHKSIYRFSTR